MFLCIFICCFWLTNIYFSFPGRLCNHDIDECALMSPCRNGGTCQNTDGSYHCRCVKGYEGKQCESNPDNCDPSKCFSFFFNCT